MAADDILYAGVFVDLCIALVSGKIYRHAVMVRPHAFICGGGQDGEALFAAGGQVEIREHAG